MHQILFNKLTTNISCFTTNRQFHAMARRAPYGTHTHTHRDAHSAHLKHYFAFTGTSRTRISQLQPEKGFSFGIVNHLQKKRDK